MHILQIFGIDNEDLQAEFAEFKGKVQSPIGTTRCLVKSILKPVHVLGNIYFLMKPYDLDEELNSGCLV